MNTTPIRRCLLLLGILLLGASQTAEAQTPERVEGPPLAGTEPLTMEGDISSHLVAGADRFLLRELEAAIAQRDKFWKRDLTSAEAYTASVATNRARLAHILGVRDARVEKVAFQRSTDVGQSAVLASSDSFDVLAVRWPVCETLEGEGLLLVPKGKVRGNVVALPDAAQTPEQLVGLEEGLPVESQFSRRLAEAGFRVVIPTIITRERGLLKFDGARQSQLPGRELLYRSAFELGRHLIGYEVQKVLAAVDAFQQENELPVGVLGYGEGGLLAFYAGALDPRIDAVGVSGYFDTRQNLWQEPVDRNVFGLLEQFGDAEIANLIVPRALAIEASRGPEGELPGEHGSAPGRLVSPPLERVVAEANRAQALVQGAAPDDWLTLAVSAEGQGAFGSEAWLRNFIAGLAEDVELVPNAAAPLYQATPVDAQARMIRQMRGIDRYNQWLLRESSYVRKAFFKPDTSSVSAFEASVEPYRQKFAEEVIGRFDRPLLPAKPRSRQVYDEEKWTGYEVVLDVFPDLFAYGLLLVPKDIAPGERRPVVVCQHGLEGRPEHVVTDERAAYKAFATRLAERGFITFAPQNLYLFKDRFRTLQRKANPLGKTLFSLIVPQHQQIVDWLQTQPFVDPERIAFYGLSYGGKSAMRIPPLVPEYSAVICSGDFNAWVDKVASTRNPRSYIWTGEYEIFEFDLGSTFDYAEMAGLIAPRPFMVERGHFDGVGDDETVGYEFGKVRHLYAAKLKIPEMCEIEWFDGPHAINGEGSFEFLHRHLNWPEP